MALPAKLDQEIQTAVSTLKASLSCIEEQAESHRAILVSGWGASPKVIAAVATYLVGLLASAISRTLEVRAQLEDTDRDRLELVQNVERIVGRANAPLSLDQKQDQRNPWIAEGLWHLCLFLANHIENVHPLGEIIAMDLPHISAKDHGLDVLALYQTADSVGISIVECKAYETDPNKAISHATETFRRIDDGTHDARIRQAVAAMRSALPKSLQDRISPSLWKNVRAYIPNPHYDAAKSMNWQKKRPVFGNLAVSRERIVVMPHAIPNFAQFFDDVAAAMLWIAKGLPDV